VAISSLCSAGAVSNIEFDDAEPQHKRFDIIIAHPCVTPFTSPDRRFKRRRPPAMRRAHFAKYLGPLVSFACRKRFTGDE